MWGHYNLPTFTTIWLFNIAMERSTIFHFGKPLFLWAIYTMANCNKIKPEGKYIWDYHDSHEIFKYPIKKFRWFPIVDGYLLHSHGIDGPYILPTTSPWPALDARVPRRPSSRTCCEKMPPFSERYITWIFGEGWGKWMGYIYICVYINIFVYKYT